MSRSPLLPALLASAALATHAQAADVLLSQTFSDGRTIADENALTSFRNLSLGNGEITSLSVGLVIDAAPGGGGAWSGDYYVYLGHNDNDGFAVLLNRIDATPGDFFTSGHNGLNVLIADTDADGDPNPDIHLAPDSSSTLTGIWAPDGRLTGENDPRDQLLASFLGKSADGEWRLFIQDDEKYGVGRLQSWSLNLGLTLTGTSLLDLSGTTLSAAAPDQVITNSLRLSGSETFAGPHDLTLAGSVTLASDTTLHATGDGLITISGNIGESGGARSLTIASTGSDGAFRLTGDNTYSGGTILHSDLVVTRGTALGTGPVSLASGSLTYEAAADATLANTLSGAGAFSKTGPANLTLSSANTHSGGVTVSAGTLTMGHAGALGSGPVAVASGATLDIASYSLDLTRLSGSGTATGSGTFAYASAADQTLGATLTGTASLAKSGAGTLTLGTATTYSGDTVISDGTVRLANSQSVLGSAVFSLDTPTLFTGSESIATGLSSAGSAYTFFTVASVSASGGPFTLLGSTVNGSPQFRLDGGQLQFIAQAAYNLGGAGSVPLDTPTLLAATLANGAQDYYVGGSLAGSTSTGYGPASPGTFLVGMNGNGDEGFRGTITALLIFDSALSPGQVASVNAYLNWRYLGGPAPVASGGSLSSATSLRLTGAGAVFDLNGIHQTVASLQGVAGSRILLGAGGTLTAGGNGASTSFAGGIEGAGTFVKTGADTLTLAGASSYSGGTTIEGGGIQIANTTGSAFGTGPVVVKSGATLSGTGAFSGPLTLEAGGLLSPGASPGLLTIGSGSQLSGTTLLELGGLDRGTGYDSITVGADGSGNILLGGTLNVVFWGGWPPSGPATFQLFTATSFAGSFAQVNLPANAGFIWDISRLNTEGLLELVAIPEPAVWAALGGLAALAFAARRKRRV